MHVKKDKRRNVGPIYLRLHLENLLNFDLNEFAIMSYNKNLSEKSFVANATEKTGEYLLNYAGLKRGELDLFAGGPPYR